MGQLNEKLKSMSLFESEERVPYDETSNNGLIFQENYFPEELLSEIFYHVDYKTLSKCQLVCKRWQDLIESYIWRKKAEMTLKHPLPRDEDASWTMYYLICHKKPFYRNLVKNHSGIKRKSISADWHIVYDGGDGWKVESPLIGIPPLPDDPVFEGKKSCFVTSYHKCWKEQYINLVDEGVSEYLLDNLQPRIKVSEWFGCRWDCPAVYECTVELLGEKDNDSDNLVVIDLYVYHKDLEGEHQNKWIKFEHEFKNYGKGLRKIKFCHGGQDKSFWAGHYGSKMAGASVQLEAPEPKQNDDGDMSEKSDE